MRLTPVDCNNITADSSLPCCVGEWCASHPIQVRCDEHHGQEARGIAVTGTACKHDPHSHRCGTAACWPVYHGNAEVHENKTVRFTGAALLIVADEDNSNLNQPLSAVNSIRNRYSRWSASAHCALFQASIASVSALCTSVGYCSIQKVSDCHAYCLSAGYQIAAADSMR